MVAALRQARIGVVGLGYVGLPLAVEFSRKYPTVGYDTNASRISQLLDGHDATLELTREQLRNARQLTLTATASELADCTVFIVTVPTPIDSFRKPDLSYLLKASKEVGELLKPGDVVIYESTVYPGCTEEDCVPVLEKYSKLTFNVDFFCGYSPERINPGDKERTLTTIVKITSGSTPEAAVMIDQLYRSIITAGTHPAPSIKVAEAAKAIENAQRDVNISFVNELALIFDRMNIDTSEVLEAAGTKWNFLKFRPGLVGGHCIGVDPYYLVHKAQSLGYQPQVISSGRLVNDGMGTFVAKKLLKRLIANGHYLQQTRVLVLGLTFKENCPDTRNTKVVDIYRELTDFGLKVDVYDPWVAHHTAKAEHHIELLPALINGHYDAIIVAVAHHQFQTLDLNTLKRSENAVVFDLKSMFAKEQVDYRL